MPSSLCGTRMDRHCHLSQMGQRWGESRSLPLDTALGWDVHPHPGSTLIHIIPFCPTPVVRQAVGMLKLPFLMNSSFLDLIFLCLSLDLQISWQMEPGTFCRESKCSVGVRIGVGIMLCTCADPLLLLWMHHPSCAERPGAFKGKLEISKEILE